MHPGRCVWRRRERCHRHIVPGNMAARGARPSFLYVSSASWIEVLAQIWLYAEGKVCPLKENADGRPRGTGRWPRLRKIVLARGGYACEVVDQRRRCGKHATVADHVVPLSRGGRPFDLLNLRASCREHSVRQGGELAFGRRVRRLEPRAECIGALASARRLFRVPDGPR